MKPNKAPGQINEERIVAASYILNFYNSVTQLTHWYAAYFNLLDELQYANKDAVAKLTEEQKLQLKEQVQTLRYYIRQSFVQWSSIFNATKVKQDPNSQNKNPLQETYNKVTEDYILDRNAVEQYVIKVNEVLTQDIIRNLLQNSNDFIESIYGDKKAE